MNAAEVVLVAGAGFFVGTLFAFAWATQVVRRRDAELKRHWETWHFTRQGVHVIWDREVMPEAEDDSGEGGTPRSPSQLPRVPRAVQWQLRKIEGGKE